MPHLGKENLEVPWADTVQIVSGTCNATTDRVAVI